jgi:hypothetical protein
MTCSCVNKRRSTPGYTLIENSTAQTWAATGGLLQPGFILEHSSANNISISGTSLLVENTGTYYIDVRVTGLPATASTTVTPTININGISVTSNPRIGGATPINEEFTVRTIEFLKSGDIITISNTGESALSITGVTSPAYNVSIVIQRFN